MPPQTIVQQSSTSLNTTSRIGANIQMDYELDVNGRKRIGTSLHNFVSNPGSYANSGFGTEVCHEGYTGPTYHVFALGCNIDKIDAANHMYSQEGIPLIVQKPPKENGIKYKGTVVDLALSPTIEWSVPSNSYYKSRLYHLYIQLVESSDSGVENDTIKSTIQDIVPYVGNSAYTVLKIPGHDFRIDDKILVGGIPGPIGTDPLTVLEVDMDSIQVDFNLTAAKYALPIDVKDAWAKLDFYTEEDVDCDTDYIQESIRFMGVTGPVQPNQFHTRLQVLTIATLIHGPIKIVMSEDNIDIFVTGDPVYMNFEYSPMIGDNMYKITYTPHPHNVYIGNQPTDKNPKTIYIGTFITELEDPVYRIALVSYVGGNRVIL